MAVKYRVFIQIEEENDHKDTFDIIYDQDLFTFDDEQDARDYVEKIEQEAA